MISVLLPALGRVRSYAEGGKIPVQFLSLPAVQIMANTHKERAGLYCSVFFISKLYIQTLQGMRQPLR